jgi:hypothetical protein
MKGFWWGFATSGCFALGALFSWLAYQLGVDWKLGAFLLYALCFSVFLLLTFEKPHGH